jgi:uncharacterized protein (TIGR03083 family)
MIELRTQGRPVLAVLAVVDAFEAHRRAFVEQLEQLPAEAWAASTRCSEWSVHEVARHLCDVNELIRDDHGSVTSPSTGFDPRTTPREWLRSSEGESVESTLLRLQVTSAAAFESTRALARRGEDERIIQGPYGPIPWTVLMLHAFWDSWLHERDVVLPLGLPHLTDDEGARLATAYSIFVAGAAASLFGTPVRATFRLSGLARGTYELLRDGDAVALRVEPGEVGGPDGVMLADALTGRGGSLEDCVPGEPATVAALSGLATFFNTPV